MIADTALDGTAATAASTATGAERGGWLAVFGLTVCALALPLLRVVTPHPEFFIAHDMGRGEVLVYVLAVTVLVPAAVATVARLAGRVAPGLRLLVVGAVGALAVAGLLQPLAGLGLFPVLAVGLGAALAASEPRHPLVRQVLGALGALSVALTVWAVGPSRTGAYVRSGEAAVLAVESEGRPAPVVFLAFDELPLTALLRSDLGINRDRFPHFARLADQSDWYRLASSVSPQTSFSVPALLSGVEPDSQRVPVASAYPSNLFLQLGTTHEVRAYEPVTALCPEVVCDPSAGGEPETAAPEHGRGGGGLGGLLRDSAVVLGHATGSEDLRAGLPAIDHSWSGFDEDAAPPASGGDADANQFAELGNEVTFPFQAERLRELVTEPPDGDRPLAVVAHLLTPHMPYVATPSGDIYPRMAVEGMETRRGTLAWPEDGPEAARAQGYQRLLLQLGAVDRLLGEVMDRLEASGVWDEAGVVVTADHGASFEPGELRDVTTGAAEVSAVPLFVKRPHQEQGRIKDGAVLTIDAVPTLLGAVGVESPSDFDGLDLGQDEVPVRRADAFRPPGDSPLTIAQTLGALRDVVDRRAEWIDPDAGWDAVYRVGRRAELVGRAVAGVPVAGTGGSWSGPAGPAAVHSVQSVRVAPPAAGPQLVEVLAACGGRFTGVGLDPRPNGDGSWSVQVVVDARRCAGAGMDLFSLSDDGALRRLERA